MPRRAEARSTPPQRSEALPPPIERERILPSGVTGWAIGPAARLAAADPERRPSEDEKRWLVYEIRDGEVNVVTPLRYERAWGESLASATARVQRAMQETLPKLGRAKT